MPEANTDFKVVGIGASSGGLSATRALLRELPARTGCAFLLVQHLHPAQESMIAELVADVTTLKVVQAVNGADLKPEHVYVIPPGVYMSVEAQKIRLSRDPERRGVPLPFDFLMRSVAKEYGFRAISVILSGTGSDGSITAGIIKAAGGLVLVQDPEEAEFEGMPRSAIAAAAGAVVLPIVGIAEAIIGYLPSAANSPSGMLDRKKAELLPRIIELLRRSTPNDFSSYKHGTLQRRIEKRLTILGISADQPEQYLNVLNNSEEERRYLANDLLINVTEFFRDITVFDFLRSRIIPDLMRGRLSDDTVRIWVAGCSTGEEAYSIAMLFLHHIKSLGLSVKFQVFGSDADPDAIAIARQGAYPVSAVQTVPPQLLKDYFIRTDSGYSVVAELRASVIFAVHNVLSDPPFSSMDLVSCRNLLIYLEPDAQDEVLALFNFTLRENGVLLIGKSETVGGMEDRFKLISKTERVYRRLGGHIADDLHFKMTSINNSLVTALLGKVGKAEKQDRLGDIVSQALLDRHIPAAILINRQCEYLYSIGPTEKFLQFAPGPASHSLYAITPKSLHNKIRSAVHRAARDDKRFVVRGAKIEVDGVELQFSIDVDPLSDHNKELFLICFIEELPRRGSASPQASGSTDTARMVELELEETRTELHDAIRGLEIAGREHKIITAEALSLNEEYQSTNEELITSKEELQSLNEELTSLNSQLHETLERQQSIFNDLENVLFSTDVPMLFLDVALKIRFFTPAMRSLFNILPSDVGRPFSDLSPLADDISLWTDAITVLETGGSVDKETAARDGRWYIRRIKPYRMKQGGIEGVVITFIDMSVQKQIAESRESAKRAAELATEAKSKFLTAASHDLRQPLQTLKLLHGLLEKSAEDPQSRIFVKRMEETLASMSGILNTVLDINQIEAGIVHPHLEIFPLNDILARLEREFSYQARAKGLELRVVPCQLLVYTDPRLLEQIIRNLLSNALKYTLKGRVLVGCRRRGEKLKLQVWDTGIGIPENQIDNVFDEYHRVDVSHEGREYGLGLGLSIVKRLSDLTGLDVSVRSTSGRGSVFSVEINTSLVGSPRVSLPQTTRETPSAPSASILVIEDEDGMRDLLEMGLEQAGYVVAAAANGSQAISLVQNAEFVPDIILADLNLHPGMDGITAITNIRGLLGHAAPALILTGDISSNTLRKCAQHKVKHLNKPAKLNDIVSAVDGLQTYVRDLKTLGDPVSVESGVCTLVEIIDDDSGVRDSIQVFFGDGVWSVIAYISAEEYLAGYDPDRASCLLIDAHLPGMSGLELLSTLREKHHRFPMIIVTGHSDVHMAVEAMKRGAVDFVEKPFSSQEIQLSVRKALLSSRSINERSERRDAARKTLSVLTTRQRQILDRILRGQPNKIIAAEMKISQRTVENHRASIMRRTGSTSLPVLLRIVVAAEE
ncbi:CheR family methyltransferase [Aliirhizobium smilacinae]|uniref:histidine kinase n=1 Tax=Aliirhizobium smilacinae TaxID=1395944 RepID=A0A5C4XJA7_9HYPH|nr:CheR family methyltransferase [Rhizobium smilacinae]TNM63605.1 response regulator [Rhizobium smilacinae]